MLKNTVFFLVLSYFYAITGFADEISLSEYQFKVEFDGSKFVEQKAFQPEVLFLLKAKPNDFPSFNAVVATGDYKLPTSLTFPEKILESYRSAGIADAVFSKECGNEFGNLTLEEKVLLIGYKNLNQQFVAKVVIVPFNNSVGNKQYLTFTKIDKVTDPDLSRFCGEDSFRVVFEQSFVDGYNKQIQDGNKTSAKLSKLIFLTLIVFGLLLITGCLYLKKRGNI